MFWRDFNESMGLPASADSSIKLDHLLERIQPESDLGRCIKFDYFLKRIEQKYGLRSFTTQKALAASVWSAGSSHLALKMLQMYQSYWQATLKPTSLPECSRCPNLIDRELSDPSGSQSGSDPVIWYMLSNRSGFQRCRPTSLITRGLSRWSGSDPCWNAPDIWVSSLESLQIHLTFRMPQSIVCN